jgi:tripartite-type tricarboxylate transporter receptor subunit TctC
MRKMLVAMSVAAVALTATLLPAAAQEWPNKPIRLICPYPPGAGADISARIMAEALSTKLGVSVVVENRAGAGGIVGMDYVSKAAPDGYTLGWPSADPITIVPAFKKTMPYRVPEDFIFVAKFVETGLTMTVSTNLPVKTSAEFVAYAKANPNKVKSGTSGVAGASDIASYLFEKNTGAKINHIPYKGVAPAMTDLLGGFVDLVFVTPATVAPQAESPKIKVLAVTSAHRHPLLPNVPTVDEVGLPGVAFTSWYGLVTPAKTPAAIVERLQKEVAVIVKDPEIKARVEKAALQLAPLFTTDFEKQVLKEISAFKALGESEKITVPDE